MLVRRRSMRPIFVKAERFSALDRMRDDAATVSRSSKRRQDGA
jgi:hypothetical protein